MSDGSVDPACVMNAFRNSVSDGRVVELDVPTRAETGRNSTPMAWLELACLWRRQRLRRGVQT